MVLPRRLYPRLGTISLFMRNTIVHQERERAILTLGMRRWVKVSFLSHIIPIFTEKLRKGP